MYRINLYDLSLSRLIRGKALTQPCTINKNRLSIKLSALINSRANRYIFINTEIAKQISRKIRILIQTLEKPVRVQGYNSKNTTAIN